MATISSILILLGQLAVPAALGSSLPSFGISQPHVPQRARLDSALVLTWNGIQKRNIAAYGNGLVHRPKSEFPGDAVSEGQGYGMLLALFMNDQTAFDGIWDAAESHLLKTSGVKSWYDWQADKSGTVIGTGAASDADQDIALALLFADSLVRKGSWAHHTSPKGADYAARAQGILNCLWSDEVESGLYLRPGQWGGSSTLNPGYFSPAWYRIFAQRDSNSSHTWSTVIDQCYRTIFANPGAAMGLVPDWSAGNGSLLASGPGYNAFAKGQWFYKDAIRVEWRLALDWLWFGEPRAKRFLDSAYAFVRAPENANFFEIDGSPLPLDSLFVFDGGKRSRPRREHSHLTLAMWACAAMAQGTDVAAPWADALLGFHDEGADFWGHPSDAAGEDTLHNEMYFDQFLAWFGAAVLSGRFANIPEELADPDPSLALAWTRTPSTRTVSLDFQTAPFRDTGILNKTASWTATIASKDGSASWSTSGRSDTVAIAWNGLTSSGSAFPQGWALVTITPKGMETPERFYVWVSHQKDLRQDSSWLVIDSCNEATLSPNFGKWASFDNASKGGSAKLSYGLVGTGSDRGLRSSYLLGVNGYQYAGLEWNASGWSGFAHATKLRFRARAAHRTVVDLYVVQSNLTNEDYLHVLDTLDTAWATYEHSFSSFTPRLLGSDALNMNLATALHWHVQHDKCLSGIACDTGSFTLENVLLGGDSKMYTAPENAIAMPDSSPTVGLRPLRIGALRAGSGPSGIWVEAPTACRLTLHDLSGRTLLHRDLAVGRTVLPPLASGMAIAEFQGEGWKTIRLLGSPR